MTDIEMPDFDNMSQEEIMRWMESLAKKQGATEGMTTAADMDIPDIDPNSVVIDEPGYVPSEKFKSSSTKTAETAAAKKEELAAAPPAPEPERPSVAVAPPPPIAPAPPPVTSGTPQRGTGERITLPTDRPDSRPGVQRPAASVQPPPAPPRVEPKPAVKDTPPWDTDDRPAQPPPPARPAAKREEPVATPPPPPVPSAPPAPPAKPTPEPAAAGSGDLAWLESLAAGLGGESLDLDLSSLGESAAPAAHDDSGADAWLSSLVASGGEIESEPPIPAAAPSKPPSRPAYEEPSSWLDALASGEDSEPIGIQEQDDLPAPAPVLPKAPGIDAADWLNALAASGELGESGFTGEEEQSLGEIEEAIREGRVSADQMQRWLNEQSEILSHQPEISLDDFIDPDAPPIPAEIPDWLLESVQPPDATDTPTTGTPALLESLFDTPPSTSSSAMPEWLQEPITSEQPSVDFDDIFADAGSDSEPLEDLSGIQPTFELETDPSDSWAEAFDMEQDEGLGSLQDEPEWYTRNVTDPARIAAVDALASGTGILQDASLPAEEELQAGQETAVPAWMTAEVASVDVSETPAVEEAPVIMGDVPDWLRETIDAPTDSDMPEWLIETGQYEDLASLSESEPELEQAPPPPRVEPKPVAPPPAPPAPKPVLAPVELSSDVMTSLAQARELSRANNLADGLRIYEALIRKNAALDDVVGDLEGLKRIYRSDPAVYRVLGDGLMRQGKLQQALDTYRDALSQL